MSAIKLKICSGLHRGADIELADGVWVFGRDDSADIILADEGLMRRHAALAVSDEGVRFEKLDGDVLDAAGKPVAGGVLAPGEFWRMGGVIMAWGPSFWEALVASLDASLAGSSAPAASQGSAEAHQDDRAADARNESSDQTANERPEGPEEKKVDDAREPDGKRTSSAGRTAPVIGLIVLLACLTAAATLTFSRTARECVARRTFARGARECLRTPL